MFAWPDPLHPAVAHFPVVLLLFGAPLASAAVFLPRLGVLAAVVLSLGSAGAAVAVYTGQQEKRNEIAVPAGEGRAILRDHEKSGERARNAGAAAAVLALGASMVRWRGWPAAPWLGVAAAVLAVVAAWQVMVSGQTGGWLVYQHGVGLRF